MSSPRRTPPDWDITSVTKALDTTIACRPATLSYFRDLVNRRSGGMVSEDYCELIAGDWIDQFIHITLAASRQDEDTDFPDVRLPVFETSESFKYAANWSPHLHAFLNSALRLFARTGTIELAGVDRAADAGRGTVRPALSQIMGRIGRSGAPVLISSPYYRCSRWEWLKGLARMQRLVRWDNLGYSLPSANTYDEAWRRSASAAAQGSGMVNALRALMPLLMPTVFLENFADVRAAIRKLPVQRPRVVYTGQGIHANAVLKFLTAEWRGQGTRLLIHQHGGGYGLDRRHTPEEYETRIADRFYSWGWRSSSPKVAPLSSTPVGKTMSYRQRGVLLCCVDYPRLPFRIHYQPMPGGIERMHDETIRFLTALHGAEGLRIRPYPTDYGWGFARRLRAAAPQATFDTKPGRPIASYRESRIVVHNYLGTGWLETLAANKPTVCFYDPAVYAFRDDAAPLVASLERVGILHRTGVDSARFVNELGDSIDSWWSQSDVKSARHEFVSRYAMLSEHWARDWQPELAAQVEAAS